MEVWFCRRAPKESKDTADPVTHKRHRERLSDQTMRSYINVTYQYRNGRLGNLLLHDYLSLQTVSANVQQRRYMDSSYIK